MTRWFAVAVALVAACGNETRDGSREAPTPVKPGPVEPSEPEQLGTVPVECQWYGAAIRRLASCRELSAEMRDTLRESYELVKVAWAHLTPEGRPLIASACLRAERQVKAASKACTFEVENPVAGLEGIPEPCHEYAAAIELLASCDKLPSATREALRQSYLQQSAAWRDVTPEGRAALGTACQSAADAVKQSAAACN